MIARLLLLVWLAFPGIARASGFASPRRGFWFDAGAGPALNQGLALSGDVNAGWWHGPYDDAYAIGRYWGVGAGWRPQVAPGEVGAVVLEIRRGVDLVVVGAHGFVAGGWTPLGPIAEVGGGVKGRFKFSGRYVGWQARIAGGAVGADRVIPVGRLTLGIEIASPFGPPKESK